MNRNDVTIEGDTKNYIVDTMYNGIEADDREFGCNNKKRRISITSTTAASTLISESIINDDDHHVDATDEKTSISEADSVRNDDTGASHKVSHEIGECQPPALPQEHSQPPLYQPNRKMKKKHMDPSILQFRTQIQNCCKNNDLNAAIQTYNNAIANQIRIEAQTFYNLLHLCSNDNDSGNTNEPGDLPSTTKKAMKIHVGTPKTSVMLSQSQCSNQKGKLDEDPPSNVIRVPIEERRKFAERVKHHMDQLQIPLTENAYTALVRVYCCCCSNNGASSNASSSRDEAQNVVYNDMLKIAEGIITEAENKQQCKVKLRLYTPLLQKYCELGLLHNAIQIWFRISKQTITLTELEYCSLLHCCHQFGSRNVPLAAIVFERVLSDLSEDILIPSHTTRRTIIQWFQSKYAILRKNDDDSNTKIRLETFDGTSKDDENSIKALLQQIQVPYEHSDTVTMGPVQCLVTSIHSGWLISDHCPIDTNTGTLLSGCLQDSNLQPVSISSVTWDHMKQMNENIAVTNKINETDTTNYQGGGKGRKVILDERTIQQRQNHWNQFQSFLMQCGTDMDILIDGANVGYYEQNFIGAPKHVDYHQINWMVQHFIKKLNKRVLLIMHSRHFASNLMPKHAQPIVQGWINNNILYQTPPGMNDDWFWLHAALHFGPGTCIVTNDEMRDHHFQMIAPRAFIRWRDRHQIHFHFGHWIQGQNESFSNDNRKEREVILQYPEPYSRRIQRVQDGLVIPLPKRGDTNRFLDGVFVANNEEAKEEMYLCIRPNHLQSNHYPEK